MKVFGLLILMVGFTFPAIGQSQIITCGHLLDRQFIQDYCQDENPREEECGLRINEDQRFAPWFELTQEADSDQSQVQFVDGLANMFRFDSERSQLLQFDFNRNILNIKLSAFSGHHSRTVLLAMSLYHRPARELDGSFYQGSMNIILNYDDLQSLPSSKITSFHFAAEVYRMPFACVANSPRS